MLLIRLLYFQSYNMTFDGGKVPMLKDEIKLRSPFYAPGDCILRRRGDGMKLDLSMEEDGIQGSIILLFVPANVEMDGEQRL